MHYERAPRLQKAEAGAVRARRGLAPAPPGFSALVPLPMRDSRQNGKRDAVASPPRSVEATESALRLLPSRALSSAQFALIITTQWGRSKLLLQIITVVSRRGC